MEDRELKKIAKAYSRYRAKKSRKFMNNVIMLILISTYIFTAMVFMVVMKTGIVPDSLIEWWFKCMVGELGIGGVIKVMKVMKGEKKNESKLEAEVDQP